MAAVRPDAQPLGVKLVAAAAGAHDAPLLQQSNGKSGGECFASRQALEPKPPDGGSGRDGSVGDDAQRTAKRTAAAAVPLSKRGCLAGNSNVESRCPQMGSAAAGPLAVPAGDASAALPSINGGFLLPVFPKRLLAPHLEHPAEVPPPQRVVAMVPPQPESQPGQLLDPQVPTDARYDEANGAALRAAGPPVLLGAGPKCVRSPRAAAATAAATQPSRAARPPRTLGHGHGRGPLPQHDKVAAGGAASCGHGLSRRSAPLHYHHDLPDDTKEEPQPVEESEGNGEPKQGNTVEEERDGAADKAGEKGGKEGGQLPVEHMPGCARCCFASVGCSRCRIRPQASRPYARWQPQGARFQEDVPSAPVFYPTPEEFADPLSYMAIIRPEAEKYGICRIVPPASCWDPPFALGLGSGNGDVGKKGDGGRECFRFQTQVQLTSLLCMRPCSSDGEQGPTPGGRSKGQQHGDSGPGRQQQSGGAAAQEQAPGSSCMGRRTCMSAEECWAGLKTGNGSRHNSRHHQEPAHQQKHQEKQKQERHRNQHQEHEPNHQQRHGQQRQDNRQQQKQKPPTQQQQQQRNLLSLRQQRPAAVASSHMGVSSGASGGADPAEACSRRAGGGPQPEIAKLPAGVRLVAPGSGRPQRRPPGAAVEPSLELYVTGLCAHPLLGLDETAAAAAAAALSAAASAAGDVGLSSRSALLRPAGDGSGGEEMASVGQQCMRSSSSGPQAPEAVAGAAAGPAAVPHNSTGRDSGLRGVSGAGSDSDGGEEWGRGSLGRTHTLRSFQAYCSWARSLHFGLPPFGNRNRSNAAGEAAAASGRGAPMTTASTAAAVLPPRVRAAVVHAAAGCEPSLDEVEAEFWRIVERPTRGLAVETLCGSDLDAARHGSGFPLPPWRATPSGPRLPDDRDTVAKPPQPPPDERARQYACHPWNINNLPHARGSVLRYLEGDDLTTACQPGGVMVPRLDVGSCLSAFCWRVEKHHLYSISYLHTGAPKVWYGVPARAAEQFDAAMRDAVPQLFAGDPLLLHRGLTHMAPNELRRRGVPVCRLVHEAGSFVVTFPNAYHAGVNCGFSVAETVNFAPVDWLPSGSAAVRRYRSLGRGWGPSKRSAVSHDGLLVRLVAAAPAVSAARQASSSLHALRPASAAVGKVVKMELGEEPMALAAAMALGAVAGGGAVKREPGSAGDLAAAATDAEVAADGYAALAAAVSAGSDNHPPNRWQAGVNKAGVSLAEVPPAAVCAAVGELALRLEEEARWRAAAREYGVTQERSMSCCVSAGDEAGVHTLAANTECVTCGCDLFLSAVVSPLRPSVATCPEHAASLGVPPESCVLLARHSMDELQGLIDAALELFPEAHAAMAAARMCLESQPITAIRRLGPISKYGLPYSTPLDEQSSREAVSEVVCAVAGPLSDEPYVPYDPEAAVGGEDASARDGKLALTAATAAAMAPVAAAATAAVEMEAEANAVVAKEDADTACLARQQPPADAAGDVSAAEAASVGAAPAGAAERERLGPRQALLLEEQQAEAERREEQRRAQEGMRRARAQRAARRSTGVAGGGSGTGSGGTGQPAPARPPAATASLLAQQPVLCVPAVAVIAPLSVPPPRPPPVLAATEAQLSALPGTPLPPATSVDVCLSAVTAAVNVTANAHSPIAEAPPGPAAQHFAMPLTLDAEVQAARPADPAAAAQVGAKRSNRGAPGQNTAVGERSVRPRRERRVPKHLLDAQMELAEEMQHVMASVKAVAAAASPPPRPPSPMAPASPAAGSPGDEGAAATVAALQKGPGSSPAATTSGSLSQQTAPQQPAPLRQPSGCAESAPQPSVQPGAVVQVDGASQAAAESTPTGSALPPRVEQQCLLPGPTVVRAAALPELPPQPPQPQADLEELLQQQLVQDPIPPCAQLPQQLAGQQPPPPLQMHALQQLHLRQPQPQLCQVSEEPRPPVAAFGPPGQPAAAPVPAPAPAAAPGPARTPAVSAADELGLSPRRSSRPTRPSVRLMGVAGGSSGAGGSGGGGSDGSAASGLPAAAAVATAMVTAKVTGATAAAPAAAGAAASAATAPLAATASGVLLLRRETSSGPSTSMRGPLALARRLSLGLSAAPGSLPPTAAPGLARSVAPPAAAPALPLPQPMPATAAPASAPLSPRAEAAGASAPSQVSATAESGAVGSRGVAGSGEAGGDRLSAVSAAVAQPRPEAAPPAGTAPALVQDVVSGEERPPASAPAIPGRSLGGTRSPPSPGATTTLMGFVDAAQTAAPQQAPTCSEPKQLLEQPHVSTLPPRPLLPMAATAARASQGAAAASSAPASGRPVRKRKTTLSHDMVIYGESAALFGAQGAAAGGAAKRKSSGDRRGAAAAAAAAAGSGGGDGSSASASATASGGAAIGASASASAGAGSSTEAPGRILGAEAEVAAVGELEDTHASLEAPPFAAEGLEEDELRPLAHGALSPPHGALFGDLHHHHHHHLHDDNRNYRGTTSDSPHMALPHLRDGPGNAGGSGFGYLNGGCRSDLVSPVGLRQQRQQQQQEEEEVVPGPSAPHSPGLLGLHDHDHDADQDDVFMAGGGRGLALSASPSANGLHTLTAMMLPAADSGDSGGGEAGYAAGLLVESAPMPRAAGFAARALQPTVQLLSHVATVGAGTEGVAGVCAPAQLQTDVQVTLSSDAAVAGAHECAQAGVGMDVGVGLGGGSAGMGDWMAGPGWEAADYAAGGATSTKPSAMWGAPSPGGSFMEPGCAAQQHLQAATYLEGSRQGLSSLSANAAAEWADLDDLVLL